MNLEELKAKAEAATRGRWTKGNPRYGAVVTDIPAHEGFTEYGGYVVCESAKKQDVEFIAAANPHTVLALVKVVEATQRFIRHIDAPSFGSHFCDLCLTDNSEGHRPDCEWLLFDAAMKELEGME